MTQARQEFVEEESRRDEVSNCERGQGSEEAREGTGE